MAEETQEVQTQEIESPFENTESTETVSTTDNTTINRPALESKVRAGLDAVFSSDRDGTEVEEETPAETDEPDDLKAAQTAAGIKEKETAPEAAADDEVEGGQKPEPKSNAPTLPAALRRTLKAYEWTDEEIDANFKALGPKLIETATKMHANRNKEVSEWANAGRAARQQQQQPRTEQGQFASVPARPGVGVIKPVDVAALKKQYGDDGLIDAIAGPVNSVVEQINALVPSLQESTQKAQNAELETLGRQIEGFFTGKELESYKELYGNMSESGLAPENIEARNKVLEFADALVAGARLQGRRLSLGEALTMAHDSVSGGFKATAARKELTKKLTTRAKGITLKPTGKKPASVGGQVSRTSLEKKVKSGLSAVFSS